MIRETRALAGATAFLLLAACSEDEPADPTGTSSSASSGETGGAGATGGSGAAGATGATGGSETGGTGGMPDPGVPYVYVGQGDGIIAWFSLDMATGTLGPLDSIDPGSNPSFLAVDPTHRFLFAVQEGGDQVAAFSIDPATAALTPLNAASSEGSGPAHVSVDGTGDWVLVANYGSGSAAVLPVGGDGSVGAAVDTEDPGVNSHMIRTDPSNQFAFVPNKGSDTISQFSFDAATGALEPSAPPEVDTANGAGPRHLDFHPTLPVAYVINELDDTVSTYTLEAGGTLTHTDTQSSLPEGFPNSDNTGADIHVRPDGKFVYASNRGHDSIVIFAIDAATGALTLVGHQPTGGSTPRNFCIDPSGQLMLVGNQQSDQVASFRIDAAAGTLTPLESITTTGGPSWVGVVTLAR